MAQEVKNHRLDMGRSNCERRPVGIHLVILEGKPIHISFPLSFKRCLQFDASVICLVLELSPKEHILMYNEHF